MDKADFYSCSNLQDLCDKLHMVFEEDHINVDHVKDLLSSYKSNPVDWRKFAKFDTHKYVICSLSGYVYASTLVL